METDWSGVHNVTKSDLACNRTENMNKKELHPKIKTDTCELKHERSTNDTAICTTEVKDKNMEYDLYSSE